MSYIVDYKSPVPQNYSGYQYWVERRNSHVTAYRHLLKGNEPDPNQKPQAIEPWQLPTKKLQSDYAHLIEASIPAVA